MVGKVHPTMIHFIVTFGYGQLGCLGQHYYLDIYAPSEMTARKRVAEEWKGGWSSIYRAEQWEARHGEIKLGTYFVYDEYTWMCYGPAHVMSEGDLLPK